MSKLMRVAGFLPGALWLLALLLPTAPAQAALPIKTRLAYAAVSTNVPILELSINGGSPQPFVINLSADLEVLIVPRVARGDAVAEYDGSQARVEVGDAPSYIAPGVRIGVLDSRKPGTRHDVAVDAIISDAAELYAYPGQKFAGVVGRKFLSRFVVAVDLSRQSIGFHPQTDFAMLAKGKAIVSLQLPQENYPRVGVAWNQAAPPIFLRLMLNSLDSIVSPDTLTAARVVRSAPLEDSQAGDVLLGDRVQVETMRVGAMTLRNTDWMVPRSRWKDTGVIGCGLLSRTLLILDLSGRRAAFGPASAPPSHPGSMGSMLWHGEAGSETLRYRAAFVLPDSPTAKAGIKFGDRIVSVDGFALGALNPAAVRQLWNASEGTTAAVRFVPLESDKAGRDEEKEVRVVRGSAYDSGFLLLPPWGAVVQRTEAGRIFCFGFAPPERFQNEMVSRPSNAAAAPARAAGLGIGDEILSINGEPVNRWSVARLRSLRASKDATPVRLQVRKSADQSIVTVTLTPAPQTP